MSTCVIYESDQTDVCCGPARSAMRLMLSMMDEFMPRETSGAVGEEGAEGDGLDALPPPGGCPLMCIILSPVHTGDPDFIQISAKGFSTSLSSLCLRFQTS